MKKLITYFRYFTDYLLFFDLKSIIASVKYVMCKKSHSGNRVIETEMGRFYCRKNTNDFQFANFRYEWEVKRFIKGKIDDFDVFIDAGAGIGDYVIWLATLGKRCYAFEPVDSNFKVLSKNVHLNHFGNMITAFPVGLGQNNTTCNFNFNPVNTGASKRGPQLGVDDILCRISTFDSLMGQLNIDPSDRILFKLDVEGMETEALMGAKEFIQSAGSLLLIIEDKHSGSRSVEDSLKALGNFQISRIDEFNICARKLVVREL